MQGTVPVTAQFPGHALVVHMASREHPGALARALTGFGFAVVVVTDFDDARNRVTTEPPDLLVTDVRLGRFNGLHLVFAAKLVKPSLAAIVVGDAEDLALSGEAERAGATFLVGSQGDGDLSGAIWRVLHARGFDGVERRRIPERRQTFTRVEDLYGRLEDKRQAIERERREFGRRWTDGPNVGH
jgi:DNA-binding NtrC family response regulator